MGLFLWGDYPIVIAAHGDTSGIVNIRDLTAMESRLMSVISYFASRVTAFNARIDTAVTGLTNDVAELKALIETLQNSLDAIEARASTIAGQLEALDALTPPTPPPVV